MRDMGGQRKGMRRIAFKVFLIVGVLLIGSSLVALGTMRLGLIPVNADTYPSVLEQKLLPMIVRASVARNASQQAVPVETSETATGGVFDGLTGDADSGEEVYKEMCAQCHGHTNGRPSVLGASFYPPAPQLPGRGSGYSEAEMFWIVKHGIRNTSMPAWRNLLSDQDIGNVVRYIETMKR